MAEVDSLEVRVQAEASKANKELDKMISNLEKMASVLDGVDLSKLSNFAKKMNSSLGKEKKVKVEADTKTATNDLKSVTTELQRIQREAEKAQSKLNSLHLPALRKSSSMVDGLKVYPMPEQMKISQKETGLSNINPSDIVDATSWKEISSIPQIEQLKSGLNDVKEQTVSGFKINLDTTEAQAKMDAFNASATKAKNFWENPEWEENLKKTGNADGTRNPSWEEKWNDPNPKMWKDGNSWAKGGMEDYSAKAKEATAFMDDYVSGSNRASNKTDSLGNRVEKLKEQLKELKGQGFNIGDKNFDKVYRDLAAAEAELKKYKKSLGEVNAEESKGGSSSRASNMNQLGQALRKAKSESDKFGNSLKTVLKNASLLASPSGIMNLFSGGAFSKFAKQKGVLDSIGEKMGFISRMFKYMVAFSLFFTVFRQAAEGMKQLALYSDAMGTSFNKNVSLLYSDMKTLRNAFATAFEPIVNVAAPYLDFLIQKLISGANALAQFFSALTGSQTWTKATALNENFAASLDKTTKAEKNAVMGFDELNKKTSASSGTVTPGTSPTDSFTTQPVSNEFANFAQIVKDAWANADFTGIGNMVGLKLKAELDSINWNDIKTSCNKIAKSVGTFINGFIGTDGLDKSIGKTIGESVNTGVGMANTFFTTVKFLELGKFLASTANSAIQTTDFKMLGQTVANGLLSGIDTWYGFITTFNFNNLGTKIGDSLKSFFNQMDQVRDSGLTGWQELGTSIGKTISGMADTLVKAFDDIPWDEVKKGFKDLLSNALSNMDINVAKVLVTIAAFKLSEIGLGLATTALKTAMIAKIASAFGTAAASGAAVSGGATIAGSIASIVIPITVVGFVSFMWGDDATKGLANFLSKMTTGKSISDDDYNEAMDFNTDSAESWNKKHGKDTGFYAPETITDKLYALIGKWDFSTGKPSFNVDITTDSKKDAGNLHAGVQGELDKLGPFKKNTITPTTGKEIYDPMQNDFVKNLFHTNTKSDTSGKTIFDMVQPQFGLNTFHTTAKSDTKGSSIQDFMQLSFSLLPFHTTAKSDTSGSAINGILNNDFSQHPLVTSAKTSNSGKDLNNILQSTFGASSLSTSAVTTDGASLFDTLNGQWNNHKSTLLANAKIDVETNSNGQPTVPKTLTSILINGFSTGGFPDAGDMFIANESGAEMVGSMNGRPAVANQSEIAQGFTEAIYPAMYGAVKSGMESSKGISAAPVVEFTWKTGEEILYKATLKGKQKYKQQYGIVAEY